MFTAVFTGKFRKDVRVSKKRGKDIRKLETLIELILSDSTLPPRYRDHPLRGDKAGHRDAHPEPDWLLIYRIDRQAEEVVFVRTGTHSDLF